MTEYFSEDAIWTFFSSYAYEPMIIYSAVVVIMFASSFGLPVPEEVTLISSGLIAYMAMNPDQYPPPTPDAEGVNVYVLATVCFVAVLFSDVVIYLLGRFFGKKIIQTNFFKRTIGTERLEKINGWYTKYGHWTCGIFRFTPGARFPGHMSCGMWDVPLYKFLLIDGTAALISVPTQVLLAAFYGEQIKATIKEFNIIVISTVIIGVGLYFVYKLIQKKNSKTA